MTKRRLKVIGIGAGNPEYITIQAVKALQQVTTFFIPLKGDDKAAIEDFRIQMIVVRKGLRGVQRELRREIDQLDAILKFFNIAFIPLLLGAATIVFALFHRTRRKLQVVTE